MGLIENQTWQQNLTAVRFSALALGDLDNDGDLDLVLTGCLNDGADDCENGVISKIYINNGTSLTENQTWQQNLTAVGYGSLAFGDVDNDGDLDLALSGCTTGTNWNCNGDRIAKVYLNNGTSLTENQTWQQNLTGVHDSSLAFGDVDNDGDLDLSLNGVRSSIPYYISKIYINNGTSLTENQTWQQNLTGVHEGELTFGDVDNDGDLDLSLTGDIGTPADFTRLYINNGITFVENSTWGVNLANMDRSSVFWSDYDNDGDLDLSLIGHTNGDHFNIYKNNGSSLVENQTRNMILNGLIGIYRAAVAFGDVDNDGDLDIAAIGHEHGYARVYENNQSNNYYFVQNPTAHANISDDLFEGSISLGDINDDGNLDLVVAGLDFATTLISKVYINNNTINNTLPKHPNSTDFSASYANNQLTLSWGNGSDNETPIAGLYYNLRVGTTSGGNQIVSGVYGGSGGGAGGGGGAAGYFGNMMQRRSITLHGSWLQANTTYYWSVQTIDTGLAKSNWSVEQNYTTLGDITYPSITINFPADNNYTSFSNVTFNATISDNVNVSNVSLYGIWGNWHRNQTNSSGINGTDYIFQANLSTYGEGTFIWAIQACDTIGNCGFSANRTVIRDLSYPLVYLESPVNESSWTANNSVTFFFNVTDFGIANCSLIVSSSRKYNFTSVTVNTSTSATVTLSNGNYEWNVSCTDMLNRTNSSPTHQLTVNYQAPSPASSTSGGGGGGGGVVTPLSYSVGSIAEGREINKELKKGDKIKFTLNNEEHNLTVKRVTSENATIEINSTIARFTLVINESIKINLTNPEFYDLFVRLNNIKNSKANLTIMAIHEAIYVKPVEEKPPENVTERIEKPAEKVEKEEEKPKSLWWLWGIIPIIIVSLTLICVWIKKKKK